MEEVIRGLIDDEILVHDHEAETWMMNTTVDNISIPENLSALITARIDRLEEAAKHVLQIASVVGHSFYHQVLALINDATNELDLELSKLQQTGLIRELTRDPELEYIFRQVLTQETAYNTILIKHRREYHRKVGEAILQLYPDRVEEFSTLLGHHFFNARDPRAFQYFQMDGDTAFRLYANIEAINYYGKAIEVAKWKDDLQLEEVVDLYLRRGRAFELDSQFKNALSCYEELEQMAQSSGNKQIELKSLIAQAQVYSVPSSEFNVELGSSIVEKAQKLAEELNERESLAKIHWINMNLNRFNHSLEVAQQAGEKAIALARELDLDELLAYSLNDVAHAYNINGQVERAKEVSLEAVELWEKMDDLPMLADSLAGLAAISVYTGEFENAYSFSDRAYSISQSTNNIWGQAYSRYSIGLVDLERGNISLALEHLKQTMKDAEKSKFTAGEALARTFLAILYSETGDHNAAISIVEEQNYPEVKNLPVSRSFAFGAELYVHSRAGNIEKAEKTLEENIDYFDRAYFIARNYFVLGQCYLYLNKKDYQNAIKISSEISSIMNDSGVKYMNSEFLLIMGIAYMKQGLMEEAKNKFEEGLQEAKRLGSRRTMWQLMYYLGLLYREQGEYSEADTYFHQAIEIIQYISDSIEDPSLRAKFLSKDEVQTLQKIYQNIEQKGITTRK
jgi:tetratricopeptide (TPR) repeat protein